MCVHAKLVQLQSILCESMDCSPLGSSVHGILQARVLDWVVMPSPPPEDLPDPGIKPKSLLSPIYPALSGGFFTTNATWEAPSQLHFCKN